MPLRRQTALLYQQIGEAIARLRKERGWTQERLARAIDMQPNYIARIETAARGATLDTLVAAAEALGVPFAALLGHDAARHPEVPGQLVVAARGLDRANLEVLVDVARALQRRADSGTKRRDPAAPKRGRRS